MLISKIKINTFKKIIVCFLFLFVLLISPIFKAQALVTTVTGPTGPSDNTTNIGPFNFSYTFKVTKGAGDSDSDPVVFAFSITIDDKPALVAGEDLKQVQILYPIYMTNPTIATASKATQPITMTWKDMLAKSSTAKKYTWRLVDAYDSTKIFAEKSFTLINTPSNSSGWYHIDKYKKTGGGFHFVVSVKTGSPGDCKTDQDAILAKYPDVILGICNQYPAEPDTPADIKAVNTDTTYQPLAPLPGLGDKFDTQATTTNPCPFGVYLNVMIKIFLGIAGVLAVIMIVWGGIQYMTTELISSKEAGKDSIVNAIFGLVLALGAYLLLYTINPDILNVCLNNMKPVEITLSEAPPTASDFNPSEAIPTGALKSCSEGISKPAVSTSGGNFTVCNSIAATTKAMVNKAWTEGYKISGWGYRSFETQKTLRVKNGCPDIMTSPPSKCKTPTAIPGTSMHESGLAIDFTCDGGAIQSQDNKCFIWLQKNSVGLGLKNLSTEPWHWSTNGN